MRTILALCLTAGWVLAPGLTRDDAAAQDTNWPSFRGRQATGVQDGYPTPVTWNADPEGGPVLRNVLWKTAVPGLGHSSPVVWGDRLFVTTAVSEEGTQVLRVGLYGSVGSVKDDSPLAFKLYCLDKHTGRVLWERTAHEGVPRVKRHPKATHANCTVATDGRHVVAFFGSEGLYCYDLDGKLCWKKDFGVLDAAFFRMPAAQWGFASSPVIHDGKVIVQCDVIKGSFIAAYRLEDGRRIWRKSREDVPTWSTPTVHEHGGRPLLIVNGFKHIGGYDARTGEEVWRLEGGGDIPVPTPVVGHGLVFITNAHGRQRPIYAIRLSASGELDPPSADDPGEHMAWFKGREGSYLQTPIVYRDHVYVCRNNGVLSCYRATTGERIYRERLGRGGRAGFSASAVAADGKLYYACETGEIFVVKAGPEFEVLATNCMGEVCMATPAISAGTLFFRTRNHVVAISERTAM